MNDVYDHTKSYIHVKYLHRSSYGLKNDQTRTSQPPHKLRQAASNPQWRRDKRPASQQQASGDSLRAVISLYSAHHGKEDYPLPRLIILLCRPIHACALTLTATRQHVGCPTQRQECHKGLLLSPGQGPQWYACPTLCAGAPQLTMTASDLQRPMGSHGHRYGRHRPHHLQ
jgi:hypothetical protein